ncbi:MAG: pirin family protein [Pseudomonadota bacterium]
MSTRELMQLITATQVTEGAGVIVRRSIGTRQRPHLDPFLMLDHFSSNNPDDYIAGFPEHPHRGFVTLTYLLDGHMLHHDSMGNRGDLRAGGAQWMKAASGVIHSEMPQQREGRMRGFQLWINLPASEKMSEPAYQDIAPEAIPTVEEEGALVRVLSGEYAGQRGPVADPHTDLRYLDVTLTAGHALSVPVDADWTVFLYAFEGEIRLNDKSIAADQLAVLGPGERVLVQAGSREARFLLVAGRPLREPIVQYGPFVMNSRAEIEQALADYRDHRLVRHKARVDEMHGTQAPETGGE